MQADEVGVPLDSSASRLIGSVEVLEQSSASASTTDWISWKTFCFSSTFSNTASITASQPARSPASPVGVIRASSSSRCASVLRPRATALSSSAAE